MKKNIVSFVTALLVFSFFALPAFAATHHQITIIEGTVYNNNHQPVSDANVTVTCNSVTQSNIHTFANGTYIAFFSGKNCDDTDTVTVTASKNNVGYGTGTGTVQNGGNRGFLFLDIDFAHINVTVPEFGMYAGAFAFMASIGSFFILRKKV